MQYYQTGSKFIWYRFTAPDGRRVRRSTKTTDKRKAQELEDKHRAQLWDEHKLGVQREVLWNTACVRWVKESTKTSINDDLEKLRWLDKFLRDQPLHTITTDRIEQIIEAKLAEGVAPATINRYTTLVGSILRRAHGPWHCLNELPHIRKLKEPDKRIRWITHEQAALLIAELPSHQKAMVEFSLATGLRESNVTGLEWSQISPSGSKAWLHPDQTKNSKPMSVPFNATAQRVVAERRGIHAVYVFTFKDKRIQKAHTAAFKKALARAGIENFRWHDLRHTWASWHVQNGTPLNVLQELGGWSSYEMVLRYAHLAPDHLADYANNIEGK